MKNKGFTLVELIIVISILSLILLIAVPGYSTIKERMEVRSDIASAKQIGKGLVVREKDIGDINPLSEYPIITRYDETENIEEYVSKGYKPQSIKDGTFFATSIQTANGKKILVGIGKAGLKVSNKIYVGMEATGWAWSEGEEISKFLETNSSRLEEEIEVPGESNEFKGETLVSKATVGQYVKYIPSKTSYTVKASESGHTNMKYNPSATTSWRVFSNDGNKVELISTESIGSLSLAGTTGYSRAAKTLNEISSAYVNDLYATSGRSVGYDPENSMDEINTTTYPLTWDETYVKGNKDFPYRDALYNNDLKIIKDNQLKQTSGYVWLASRKMVTNSTYSKFGVNYLGSNGEVYYDFMRTANADGTVSTIGFTYGVRPIITLKPEVKVTEIGEGTLGSPYELIL